MPLARGRRIESVSYWPGFVDALSTMLLVIIFLLSVFMLAQFFLSREVTTKDSALSKLNRQIEELTSLLSLERVQKGDAEHRLSDLNATLEASKAEQARAANAAAQGGVDAGAAKDRAAAAANSLEAQKAMTADALSQVDILNRQISALRRQLAAIEDALAASESAGKESQAKIADLGSRLNVALAQKVQELSRYRSDFFGRLRQILGAKPGITVVGDRFVFQSSVLFDTGKAEIHAAGLQSLDSLAAAVLDLEREIPPDIPWILRIDGHTDKQALSGNGQFKSNWELSSARAISVVLHLIGKGIEPTRLAAAGFGEFQPIAAGSDDESLAQNRRIELKLTER